MIPVIYDAAEQGHVPDNFVVRGVRQPNKEVPERAELMLSALKEAGYEIRDPDTFGLAPLKAVHTERYLEFLENGHAEWMALGDTSPEIIPNAFPVNPHAGYPTSIIGRAGFHQGDMACPINAGTWAAARGAADCALTATRMVRDGARAVYALCRPPGHHAFADRAAGFCFLNNAAIAAQFARDQGTERVAILDVDVHHGNGTQDIFYDRSDVFFASVQADPAGFYPFFWGYADQTGAGEGEGFTANYPLPMGSGEVVFLEALNNALARIADFDPGLLVLSLGIDISINDPYAALEVTAEGFAAIGNVIESAGYPTVILQEGGYVAPDLGTNVVRVLEAFG